MARWVKDAGEIKIKVAVIGQPGSEKAKILRHLASSQGQAAVRTGLLSEVEITRTEFIWPDPIPDGPFVRVRVFALSGHPAHQAAEQVLMASADAIVFVVDCAPHSIEGSRDCLLAMMSNAAHAKVDWEKMVVVMQYNRAELYPHFKPHDLDTWLGIENGKVARYVTSSDAGDDLGVAVRAAVKKVVGRLSEQAAEPTTGSKS